MSITKRLTKKCLAWLLCLMVAVTFVPTFAFADEGGSPSYPVKLTVNSLDGKTITEKTVDLAAGADVTIKNGQIFYTGVNKKPDPRCIGMVTEYVELADVLKLVDVDEGSKCTVTLIPKDGKGSDAMDISKLLQTRYASKSWAEAEIYTTDLSDEGKTEAPAVLALKSFHTNKYNDGTVYAECLADLNAFADKADTEKSPRFFYGQDVTKASNDSDSLNNGNLGFNCISNVDSIVITETEHSYENGCCKICGTPDPQATEVITAINAIPETITLDSDAAITAARTAYNELTKAEKKHVGNYSSLVEAEKEYAAINGAYELIEAIPEYGEELPADKADAVAKAAAVARTAYDKLDRAEKKQIKNYSRLEIAEEDVAAYIDANKAVGKVKTLKLTKGKKKATVKWSKVSGATGYKIYRSTKKSSGFKCVKTVSGSTVKYVNTKLKSKKNYYYKVRAYKTVCGKTFYGGYSAVKKVKTK